MNTKHSQIKKIIFNLEKQIHFLKNEIDTENEIIKNLTKNDPHRDENNNVPQDGQMQCLHTYQMTQIPILLIM